MYLSQSYDTQLITWYSKFLISLYLTFNS